MSLHTSPCNRKWCLQHAGNRSTFLALSRHPIRGHSNSSFPPTSKTKPNQSITIDDRCDAETAIYPVPICNLPHLISSHLISSHLISSHLISSHFISSHSMWTRAEWSKASVWPSRYSSYHHGPINETITCNKSTTTVSPRHLYDGLFIAPLIAYLYCAFRITVHTYAFDSIQLVTKKPHQINQ